MICLFADILLKFREQQQNRVAGGFSPPAPTPPGKRVRTGRFQKEEQA
jgi:hypothetical protein